MRRRRRGKGRIDPDHRLRASDELVSRSSSPCLDQPLHGPELPGAKPIRHELSKAGEDVDGGQMRRGRKLLLNQRNVGVEHRWSPGSRFATNISPPVNGALFAPLPVLLELGTLSGYRWRSERALATIDALTERLGLHASGPEAPQDRACGTSREGDP
jgi:hypothetical protein